MKRQFFSQQSHLLPPSVIFSPPPSIVKDLFYRLEFLWPTCARKHEDLWRRSKAPWTWSLHTRAARSPAVRMYTHFGETHSTCAFVVCLSKGHVKSFPSQNSAGPWLLGYQTNHFNLEPSRLQTLRFAQALWSARHPTTLWERSQDVPWELHEKIERLLALFESKSALLSQSKSVLTSWKYIGTTYAKCKKPRSSCDMLARFVHVFHRSGLCAF